MARLSHSKSDSSREFELITVPPTDSRVSSLLEGSGAERDHSWREEKDDPKSALSESNGSLPAEAVPLLLLLLARNRLIAGGLLRKYDGETLDLNRIWIEEDDGNARVLWRLFVGLEDQARKRGFSRVHLRLIRPSVDTHSVLAHLGYTHRSSTSDDFGGALDYEKIVEEYQSAEKRVRNLERRLNRRRLTPIAREGSPAVAPALPESATVDEARNGWRLDSGYL